MTERQPAADIPFSLDESTRCVRVGVVEAVLSEARFRLLATLARDPGQWRKSQYLISSAFGTHHATDSALVRVHMNGIRNQLGIARWCLQSERTFGYQFVANVDRLETLGSRRPWSSGPIRDAALSRTST